MIAGDFVAIVDIIDRKGRSSHTKHNEFKDFINKMDLLNRLICKGGNLHVASDILNSKARVAQAVGTAQPMRTLPCLVHAGHVFFF